jgi:hypothetical protein
VNKRSGLNGSGQQVSDGDTRLDGAFADAAESHHERRARSRWSPVTATQANSANDQAGSLSAIATVHPMTAVKATATPASA